MTKTCLECGKVFEHENSVMVMALVISHECEKESESELKEWVEDRQLNGDDGSGFDDYESANEL